MPKYLVSISCEIESERPYLAALELSENITHGETTIFDVVQIDSTTKSTYQVDLAETEFLDENESEINSKACIDKNVVEIRDVSLSDKEVKLVKQMMEYFKKYMPHDEVSKKCFNKLSNERHFDSNDTPTLIDFCNNVFENMHRRTQEIVHINKNDLCTPSERRQYYLEMQELFEYSIGLNLFIKRLKGLPIE